MAERINLNAHRPVPRYPRCEECRHAWHGTRCTTPRFSLKHHRSAPCGCESSARAAG